MYGSLSLKNKYIGALQFHHKNREEKSYELSKKLSSYSFEKLKSEADKCVLVCSTCHAEIEGGVTKCPN